MMFRVKFVTAAGVRVTAYSPNVYNETGRSMLTIMWLTGASILVGIAGLQPHRAMTMLLLVLASVVVVVGVWTELSVSQLLAPPSTAGKVWTSPVR